jgi:hypothetical protein
MSITEYKNKYIEKNASNSITDFLDFSLAGKTSALPYSKTKVGR